jgi:hypothetical protein
MNMMMMKNLDSTKFYSQTVRTVRRFGTDRLSQNVGKELPLYEDGSAHLYRGGMRKSHKLRQVTLLKIAVAQLEDPRSFLGRQRNIPRCYGSHPAPLSVGIGSSFRKSRLTIYLHPETKQWGT